MTVQMRQEMKSMIDASEQSTTRAMTDMDVRVQSMKQKVNTLEQALDSRISEVSVFFIYHLGSGWLVGWFWFVCCLCFVSSLQAED